MPIGIDPDETWDYVLEDDRTFADGAPNPSPTVFELGVLDCGEAAQIEDSATVMDTTDKTLSVASGSSELKILRLGLRGCRNFFDASGKPIEFEAEPDNKRNPKRLIVTNRFLNRLSLAHRAELAKAIQLGNRITDAEKKA